MWCWSSRNEKSTEVSERFKYALNGVYTIENLSSTPLGFETQGINIGSFCGKQWRIYLRSYSDHSFYAVIGSRGLPSDDLKISAYFNFVNKNRKIKLEDRIHFEKFDWAVFSKNIKVEDVLEQNRSDLVSTMEIASHYQLSNVVKYLERQMFQRHFSSKNIRFWTRKAIQFDLNHLLSQLMRRDDSRKILKFVKTKIPEMSGRIMKMIIAKYLYAKV
ncbi:unnamed protein product [Caenorhabditis brenneri]